MEVTLKLKDVEVKLILDLISKSDPMGFYCQNMYKSIASQYNDAILPQGNINTSGFQKVQENIVTSADARMIKQIEEEIKKESV